MFVRDRNILEVLQKIKTAANDTLQIEVSTSMTRDEMVTSDVVYETAHSILSRGMNEVSCKVLGYLAASLQAASRSERPSQLRVARARELVRRSGCLQDMLDMFLGPTIMKEENWKILCECLAESCDDYEDNQNYCSSLIPVCVKRSDVMSGNIQKLLRSLLMNNTRNISLFVECNGTSIFTKNSVHDSSRMELLSMVVQNASAANLLKRDTDLMNSLFKVKENCQGSWKMVEWASVILYHIASNIEGIGNLSGRTWDNSKTTSSDSFSFLLKSNWDKVERGNVFKQATKNVTNNPILKSSTTALKPLNEDTMNSLSSMNSFIPEFVSTPKRRITNTNEQLLVSFSKQLKNSTAPKSDNPLQLDNGRECRNKVAPATKKKLSTSARLFNMVNNSCVAIYNMMGTIFSRNPANKKPECLLKYKSDIKKGTKLETNRFTEQVKQRVSQRIDPKASGKLNDQKQPKRQVVIRLKHRKSIVKKLKTGMYIYGCNFKKIAEAMWPHEKQMTPTVLYKIYRKCIVK